MTANNLFCQRLQASWDEIMSKKDRTNDIACGSSEQQLKPSLVDHGVLDNT